MSYSCNGVFMCERTGKTNLLQKKKITDFPVKNRRKVCHLCRRIYFFDWVQIKFQLFVLFDQIEI